MTIYSTIISVDVNECEMALQFYKIAALKVDKITQYHPEWFKVYSDT